MLRLAVRAVAALLLLLLLLLGPGCAEEAGEDLPALPPLTRAESQRCLAGLPDPPPALLSETGCFDSLSPLEPGEDLVPYHVVSPLWTDGARKERYLVLPPGTSVGFAPSGAWTFPAGTVLVKVFAFETVEGDPASDRVFETRFMVRREAGWSFYSYQWNDDHTDATLLDAGLVVDVELETREGPRTVAYTYPSRDSCETCHSEGIGVVLGPRTVQLNTRIRYGERAMGQLEALAEIGVLDMPADLDALPDMVDPADESARLEARARSYLHSNCSHCHQPGGWTSPGADQDLRYETPLADARICDVPVAFDLVPGGDYRIAAGDPERSSIWRRMQIEGIGAPAQMPPVGRSTVDPLGSEVVRQWIESLTECPE